MPCHAIPFVNYYCRGLCYLLAGHSLPPTNIVNTSNLSWPMLFVVAWSTCWPQGLWARLFAPHLVGHGCGGGKRRWGLRPSSSPPQSLYERAGALLQALDWCSPRTCWPRLQFRFHRHIPADQKWAGQVPPPCLRLRIVWKDLGGPAGLKNLLRIGSSFQNSRPTNSSVSSSSDYTMILSSACGPCGIRRVVLKHVSRLTSDNYEEPLEPSSKHDRSPFILSTTIFVIKCSS